MIIEDGKTHNSKIATEHLLNMKEKFENIMDNENFMFGDAAYDSNVLRTTIENRFDRYKINFESTVKLTTTFYMFSLINQISNS
ncbi:MAG: hypothetical protein ACKPKO_03975 [Candidatus Fonsibacter sp.]